MSTVMVFIMAVAVALVLAAEPELTTDFSGDSTNTNSSFFKFIGFRDGVTAAPGSFLVKKASVAEFPALNGLGVSIARLSFQSGSVNPPHIHPRGTEILCVEQGWLNVGLVDSSNKLYIQRLETGDCFVFPRGLVHFQYNDGQYEVKAISAFGSSNAGTVSIPINVFGSGIDDIVLSKAFKVNVGVIKTLKDAFAIRI